MTTEPRVMRSGVLSLLVAALVLLVGFWWLGVYVTKHGEPPALWAFAQAVRGHGVWVAWAFTNAGWPAVLGPLYAASIAVAIFVRPWRVRAVYLVSVALVAWGCADAFQRLFARPRRLDWLIRHEHAFSYPSSHAAISTAFYFLAAVLLLRSELRPWIRYCSFAILIAMWLGILWSRLALAAHYPTDVIAGTCLGVALALLGAAFVRLTGGRLVAAPGRAP
jgi:membrane-associated phospholipid phosphatase